MAGYNLQRIDGRSWKVLDRKSGEQVGFLRASDGTFSAESEQLKMQAEASDPWLILRMVFNTEEFLIAADGEKPKRITIDNARELLK